MPKPPEAKASKARGAEPWLAIEGWGPGRGYMGFPKSLGWSKLYGGLYKLGVLFVGFLDCGKSPYQDRHDHHGRDRHACDVDKRDTTCGIMSCAENDGKRQFGEVLGCSLVGRSFVGSFHEGSEVKVLGGVCAYLVGNYLASRCLGVNFPR